MSSQILMQRVNKNYNGLLLNNIQNNFELYTWSRRAEAVGIASMPPKRPTKGQRLAWEMSIIRAEDEQSNTNAES